MDFLKGIFGRNRDNDSLKSETEFTRKNLSFERLKKQIIGNGRNFAIEGLSATDITLGELADACFMYCNDAEAGADMAMQTLENIVETQIPDMASQANSLIMSIKNSFEVDTLSSIYSTVIDLKKIIEHGQEDLTHYPGGLLILNKLGQKDKYEFLLSNRQRMDDGKKAIADHFTQVGLPVRSNIV